MFLFVLIQITGLLFGFHECSELLEPDRHTFSRYEFLEKLLERSIRTDIQTQEYNKAVEKALGSIKDHNQEFEGLKANIQGIVDEWRAVMENQTQLLDQVVQNITQLQERLLIPTIQFSAKDVRDVSPTQNQVIIFPTVLQNIGNCYNPGTGVFTAPTNGTYIFSMQTCTYSAQYAYFQLVVDSSDNVILVLRNYDSAAYTTTSDSVPHYLMVGQRVWVQSYLNSGTTITLVHVEENCWNHFSGVLVNF